MSLDTRRLLELVEKARHCVEDVVIPEACRTDAGALLFAAEETLDEIEEMVRDAVYPPIARRAEIG